MELLENIIKGFYPYFAVPAAAGIAWRIAAKRWRRAESIVLGLALAHLLLLLAQSGLEGNWYLSRRYLLPAAPLLFGWAAWFIAQCYRRFPRIIVILAIAAGLFLLYDAFRPALEEFTRTKGRRRLLAVELIAPVIRADYSGPAFFRPRLQWREYCSPARPVVRSPFPILGLSAGGRHWEESTSESLTPDYWVAETNSPPPNDRYVPMETFVLEEIEYGLWKYQP